MRFVVDDQHYPIVVVTFPQNPSDADVRAFIDANRSYLSRQDRHCSIVDMRQIAQVPPPLRRMTADYIRDNYDELRRWRAGTAFVVATPVSKGIAAAVMWLQGPPYPWTTVSSLEQAFAWCDERLKA